ncbi:hypothetical protein MVEG_03740 [Podila verticillata NRRL 6337]|nr:hypothetical protein MVEG_03740 [Podila verticillata NRRL 6337]
MTGPDDPIPPPTIFQQFTSKSGEPLQSIQTHTIGRFGDVFVYWSEIQDAFPDVNYLLDNHGERVFFEVTKINGNHEFASPIRIKAFQHPFTVVTCATAKTPALSAILDFRDISSWQDRMHSANSNIIESPEYQLYVDYYLSVLLERQKSDPSFQSGTQQAESVTLSVLDISHKVLEFAAPRLFLFLPSDLNQWDDLDPSTQSFRLYFLCDCGYKSTEESHPTYVHISNHPGYDVEQPLEFIRHFGRSSLTILEAVKNGFVGKYCNIPKLDTLQILESFEGQAIQYQLAPETIGALVDKAIAYISEQERSQDLEPNVTMSAASTQHMQSFFRPRNCDNGMGSLNRVIIFRSVKWLCQRHAFKDCRTTSLVEYIHSHGGSIDLQLANITINLGSLLDVNTFVTTVAQSNHTFDLSLDFTWNPSRVELQAALDQLSELKPYVLQINGATLDFGQSPTEYGRDPFARHIDSDGQKPVRLIVLSSFPRPSESYVYFDSFGTTYGFIFESMVNKLNVNWMELAASLKGFDSHPHDNMESDELSLDGTWVDHSRILSPLLAQGLKSVDVFDQISKMKRFRLGVKDGAVTGISELCLPCRHSYPETKKHPVLQRLVIRREDDDILGLLYTVMNNNPDLQLIDIVTPELQVFEMLEALYHTWLGTRTVLVTLFDYNLGNGGVALVRMLIGARSGSMDSPVDILIHEWNYDHISEVLEDWDAAILGLATEYWRTSLMSLALNTSRLSEKGLTCIQEVLEQSDLEFLSIECDTFDPSFTSHLGHVLKALNWSVLKSLTLSGSSLDTWIDLWAKYGEITKCVSFKAQLLRLRIVGSDRQEKPLSSSSVLWLHNVIYLFSPMEVHLKNIQLQDNRDWDLVIDAIDFSQLVVLDMFKSNFQHIGMLLEKLGEQKTLLEELDLRFTPADEELRQQFREN